MGQNPPTETPKRLSPGSVSMRGKIGEIKETELRGGKDGPSFKKLWF